MFEIVECREGHLPAVREFFAQTYRPDYVLCADEALFRWQFRGPGEARDFHLKLAFRDGAIAGCLGYIPVEVSLRGQTARGAWNANWMVAPEFRRLGLGPVLLREVMRQFEIDLVIGMNEAARAVFTGLGWKDFGRLHRWVSVLDVEAASALVEDGRLDWPEISRGNQTSARSGDSSRLTAPTTEAVTTNLARSGDLSRLSTRTIEVVSTKLESTTVTGYSALTQVSTFSDDATEFWDRVWGARGAGTRRTATYLNWRYAQHPVFVYRCFEARRSRELVGLGVHRIESVRGLPDARVGRILELIALPEEARPLLAAIEDDARREGVAMLDFFCSSRRLESALAAHGYLSDDESPAARLPILFQPLDRRRASIPFMGYFSPALPEAALAEWYVTKGDGDQDRPN